jgi:hypothetical protein
MFKNEMVQMLVDLQKKGIQIHLTNEGYTEFLKLLQEQDANTIIDEIAG